MMNDEIQAEPTRDDATKEKDNRKLILLLLLLLLLIVAVVTYILLTCKVEQGDQKNPQTQPVTQPTVFRGFAALHPRLCAFRPFGPKIRDDFCVLFSSMSSNGATAVWRAA